MVDVVNSRIQNERQIKLRPIEREDLPFLRDLANDPEVRRNVVGWDWPLSLAGQERWFEAGIDSATTRRFMVESMDGKPIGMTGLWEIDWHNRSAMVAIKLGGHPEARRKGYGVDTVRAVMDFAFRDVGINRLYASFLETNEGSRAVFVRKCGWKEEGIMREHVWREGFFRDVIHVGILKREYELHPGGEPQSMIG